MNSSFASARQKLADFFYTPEVPYGLALIRIVLPIVMMSMIVPRWPYCREIYSSDGAPAPLWYGYGFVNYLPFLDGNTTVALFSLLVLTLFTVSLGFCTRVSTIVCLVLYTYFCHLDAISTMTKYSVITTHLLLLLSVSDCGRIWSLDEWFARQPGALPARPLCPAWPRRLIQLMIGFVYFGAAITKMNTPTFLSGDQLQMWMMTHINFRHPLGELLSLYPALLKAMSYVTLVWEVTFLFLVWKTMFRPWVLAIGILFHFMTVLTLGLMIFPMVCYTTYLSFADADDFHQLHQWWQKTIARSVWLTRCSEALGAALTTANQWSRTVRGGQLTFAGLVGAAVAGGVAAEYVLDPYGIRRPEGPYALKEADPQIVARMFDSTAKIRDSDKFFAVDTGTMLIGDLLADRRRVFWPGEAMIVQCNLTPPHEDMWIEFKVLDSDNRLVDRMGNIALREQFRANFTYRITQAMSPGDYTLVFETAGREVIRKRITVGGETAAAN